MRESLLGFGCGSVLGRVGRGASLRAMGAAWDQGITLFDTARSYGFGEAEGVLGEFLRGKRDRAVIATKFGIAPQRQSALKRAALPLVRAAMKVPGVRGALRGGGERATVYGDFTVAGLRSSLEESLRQLRTDYVDVLFLHEATAGVWRQDDLMAELNAVVKAGKARRVGLYGAADVIAAAPPAFGAMQFGGDMFDPAVRGILARSSTEMLLVANHPFGSVGRVARMKALLKAMAADERVPAELREKVREGEWEMVVEALFGAILLRAGALVLSMMQPEHVQANVRAVSECRFSQGELEMIRERMAPPVFRS